LRHRRLRQTAELCSAQRPCLRPRPHTSRACGRLCMYGVRIEVCVSWWPCGLDRVLDQGICRPEKVLFT